MKLNLSSDFTKNMVSKVLTSAIRKKTGYNVDICLYDLDIQVVDGNARIIINAQADIDKAVLNKIMQNITGF